MKSALYGVLLLSALSAGFLLGQHHAPAPASSSAPRVLYYVDPMHPAYTSDKPGIAPDCGMPLVPVYADERGRVTPRVLRAQSDTVWATGTVNIDSERQRSLGIHVAPVEETSGSRSLRIPGRVTADESRVFRVNSGVEGYVKSTHGDTVGSRVRKGERLAVVYSPDFVSAAGGYLTALARAQDFSGKDAQTGAQIQSTVLNWIYRLRTMGMSDAQIKELDRTRTIPDDIYIVSPVTGFVLARNILPGQGFERRMEFYRIADLSQVWIVADLFGTEAEYLRPGIVARVTSLDEKITRTARVSDSLPQIDPNTRALKLRLQAANPDLALRPDMFVRVDLTVPVDARLSVPADAVLDSGLSRHVFVDRGHGVFEPREVETGEPFGDRVEIVSGLTEGERVVDSGTFLVDSESRLRTAAASVQPAAAHHSSTP